MRTRNKMLNILFLGCNYIFRKFTLLCAISNSKCIGATLYKEGGMTKERFVEFLEANIFNKYKNHLIILDNAGSHNNEYVKQAIINSGNKYLFTIPYTPKCNAIEQYFNQIKHYLKLNKKVLKYDELVIDCLLYTSPSPRDRTRSRMPSSA